jgi:TolA-binding protein
MKAKIIIALLLCAGITLVAAQEQVPQHLADGLRAFQAGDMRQALRSFREARARDDIPGWQGHALFWLARTQMAMGSYDEAADSFDLFLSEFEDHPYREETRYQRARIFHLREQYETAISRFNQFLERYPESDFYANALYWAGESLFALGRLGQAEQLFAEVTDNHQASYRAEAARYRLDIIEFARRENELLTLLQWSHEEYLSALESFQQRERSYQEALETYRNRLAGLATEDFQAEIAALNQEIDDLEDALAAREERINELLARVRRLEAEQAAAPQSEGTPAPGADEPTPSPAPRPSREQPPAPDRTTGTAAQSDLELRETLLSLKAQALELQELLLEDREADQ